jgi:hypothetical protein
MKSNLFKERYKEKFSRNSRDFKAAYYIIIFWVINLANGYFAIIIGTIVIIVDI